MTKSTLKSMFSIPPHIRFMAGVYLRGLAVFTLFRLMLFLVNLDQYALLPENRAGLILRAFVIGFRFDTVVSGYILIVPFLALTSAVLLRRRIAGPFLTWVSLYTGILYALAFFICSVDIPYFNYFFSRLSAVVFVPIGSPGFVFKLIFQEVKYWIYLLPFAAVCGLFWWWLMGYRKKIAGLPDRPWGLGRLTAFSLLALMLLFTGIRGRLAIKSPIRTGTAFFSSHGFANQLGLNPVFTLARSILDDLEPGSGLPFYMEDRHALERVRNYFNADPGPSPVARRIKVMEAPLEANLVLVIMESMSAELLGCYGNPGGLTPHLDRLAGSGYVFDNIYTSGIHTYSGVYSCLFGYPVYLRRHPLKGAQIPVYGGLPETLRKQGYRTIYFTTHDDQFDNIGGFLRANGMERVVSEKDYPSKWVLSTLGVPDHRMFEFSIPLLNRMGRENRPFFATFLTASNHRPYIIPGDIPFRPRSAKTEKGIVEYADWALGRFMELAAAQEWFDRTVFVFIADSGSHIRNSYDLPLSFFHTPLIVHAPGLLKKPLRLNQLGGQIDLFPTVMGLLRLDYVNNSFGIDLLNQERPFIYFCGDDKVGCLSDEYFLVIRPGGSESLYRYASLDSRDYIEERKPLAGEMKDYCFSMLQTSQWMIRSRLQRPVR